jgi:hypothetical protein
MLNLHNSIVGSMNANWRGQDEKEIGRGAFIVYNNVLKDKYWKFKKSLGIPGGEEVWIEGSFDEFWKAYHQELGHYFRFLYNMIRFIDESSFSEEKKYIRLVRAQLSDYELVILFYNSISEQGKNFRDYVIKYDLLDNMNDSLLFDPSHEDLLEKGVGSNASNQGQSPS